MECRRLRLNLLNLVDCQTSNRPHLFNYTIYQPILVLLWYPKHFSSDDAIVFKEVLLVYKKLLSRYTGYGGSQGSSDSCSSLEAYLGGGLEWQGEVDISLRSVVLHHPN